MPRSQHATDAPLVMVPPEPEVPWRPTLVDARSDRRPHVERWIRDRFASVHRANVSAFLPRLLVIDDGDDDIVACAGFGAAGQQPLLLEHYLDGAIEDAVHKLLDRPPRRSDIVEIGNLAASDPGHLPILFMALSALLRGLDFEWAAFTATRPVRAALRRARFPFIELTAATGERLGSAARDWGTYYCCDPRVAVVHQEAESPVSPAQWRGLLERCRALGSEVDRDAA